MLKTEIATEEPGIEVSGNLIKDTLDLLRKDLCVLDDLLYELAETPKTEETDTRVLNIIQNYETVANHIVDLETLQATYRCKIPVDLGDGEIVSLDNVIRMYKLDKEFEKNWIDMGQRKEFNRASARDMANVWSRLAQKLKQLIRDTNNTAIKMNVDPTLFSV